MDARSHGHELPMRINVRGYALTNHSFLTVFCQRSWQKTVRKEWLSGLTALATPVSKQKTRNVMPIA